MTWARRRSDLPPDQLEDAVAALTADEAPEMDQMLAEYAAGSAGAAWEFDQGMFAFGKPSPEQVWPKPSNATCATGSPKPSPARRP
jgi:hypothetical protein